jgi:hypothetical protein
MKAKQHIFEVVNLGNAPYRLVRVEMREQDPNDPKVGSSCDYCATYITNIFHCESADGKKFVIGSTCIDKLGDAGLKKVVDAKVREHRRELRRAQAAAEWEAARPEREAHEAKLAAERKIETEALVSRYETAKAKLAKRPHPNAYFASKGKTMLDYAEYMGGVSSYRVQRLLDEVAA